MRKGILGGTFNPIHYGHLRMAEEVRERLTLDKVLFIPAAAPPLKTTDIEGAEHRYEMTRLAVLDNPAFELSDIEYRRKDKSFTVDTLEELKRRDPDSSFFFICGIDTFLDIPNWWKPEKLLSLADFVIVSRPPLRFIDLEESPFIDLERSMLQSLDNLREKTIEGTLRNGRKAFLLLITPIGISSTGIRKYIRQRKSVKYLLPPEVRSYIINNGLYGDLQSPDSGGFPA